MGDDVADRPLEVVGRAEPGPVLAGHGQPPADRGALEPRLDDRAVADIRDRLAAVDRDRDRRAAAVHLARVVGPGRHVAAAVAAGAGDDGDGRDADGGGRGWRGCRGGARRRLGVASMLAISRMAPTAAPVSSVMRGVLRFMSGPTQARAERVQFRPAVFTFLPVWGDRRTCGAEIGGTVVHGGGPVSADRDGVDDDVAQVGADALVKASATGDEAKLRVGGWPVDPGRGGAILWIHAHGIHP